MHRTPPPPRAPQLNTAIGAVYRAKVKIVGRAEGRTAIAVLRAAIDCYLGDGPPITPADRHVYDAMMRQQKAAPPRKKRGPTDA